VRHSAAGVSILGWDDLHPSQQTHNIFIRNNVFTDIDNKNWGGNGYFLQMVGAPRDITVDHNTVIQDDAYGIVTMDGSPILGMTFTNNLARQNAYGIIGSNHGVGNDSISAYLPASQVERNVFADAGASHYPGDNLFPSSDQFKAQFVSYAGGDYHLVPSSAWRNGGTDGADLGADLTAVPSGPPSSQTPQTASGAAASTLRSARQTGPVAVPRSGS